MPSFGQSAKPAPKKREDPRTTRTRKLLQAAFMQLLNEKSFEGLTVQDITERATVNRATFYAHFEDKNDLLDRCIRESFAESLAGKVPRDAELNAEMLRSAILVVCQYLGGLYTHCKPQPGNPFEPLVEREIKTHIQGLVAGWLKKRRPLRGPTATELAATAASWAIYGAAVQWARGARTLPAEKLARQVFPMVDALLNAETG